MYRKECSHKWAYLLGENFSKLPIKVCLRCGCLKIGNTILITGSYIDFALLTSNPAGVEGRVCYNSTDHQMRHYDGTNWRDW